MQNIQTRAALQRRARAGQAAHNLQRAKRLSDLAWQVNLTTLTLSRCQSQDERTISKVEALRRRAETEYQRLTLEGEI